MIDGDRGDSLSVGDHGDDHVDPLDGVGRRQGNLGSLIGHLPGYISSRFHRRWRCHCAMRNRPCPDPSCESEHGEFWSLVHDDDLLEVWCW